MLSPLTTPMTFARRAVIAGVVAAAAAMTACTDEPTRPTAAVPRAPSLTTGNGAVLAINPAAYDFGSLPIDNQSAVTPFIITNAGTGDLIVDWFGIDGAYPLDFALDMKVQSPCTSGIGLGPGDSCVIGVRFTPAYIRADTATLHLMTTAADTLIQLTGIALPAAQATPDSLAFGKQEIGTQSASQAIRITNLGSNEMWVYDAVLDSPDDFVLAGTSTTACNADMPVKPSESCDVLVAFKPSASGVRSTSLTVQTSEGWIVAKLAGTGLLPSADVSAAITSALQGKTIVYQLTAKNLGPSGASGVMVTDTIPSGATFASLSAPSGVSCAGPNVGATGTVTCAIASLASGASRTIQLSLRVVGGTKGSIVNTVAVRAESPVDLATGNNTTNVTTVLGRK